VLHLRLSLPSDRTDDVLAVLEADTGVSALAVIRGASLRPVGDLVTADIAREAANDVVMRLRDLGVHETGSLHLVPIQTWLSRSGYDAERATPGSGADSVVWAEVTQHAYEDSELNWTYLTFMTLATLIAAVGIILDSQILIIGAMVLGPEFGTVAALGVALVRGRKSLLARAARTLVGGFGVAIVLTTLAAWGVRALGWVSSGDVSGPRPGTHFIYFPDKWSFVVAVVAAAAGVLSVTSARTGGLSGVFISVTTIPAAGNIALGLAFGATEEIRGSTLQLLINLTGMAIAGWVTLAIQQTVWQRMSANRARLVRRVRRH